MRVRKLVGLIQDVSVAEEVKQLTNNQQTPVLQKPDSIRDFPLGVVGGR